MKLREFIKDLSSPIYVYLNENYNEDVPRVFIGHFRTDNIGIKPYLDREIEAWYIFQENHNPYPHIYLKKEE